jgi:hypothetical protein
MSNYVQSTNFATKDNLSSGDPLKIVKGTEINTEFANIAIAVATKADLASPTLTGTPAAPTASSGTNTTQLATTAFVQAAVTAGIQALHPVGSIYTAVVSTNPGTLLGFGTWTAFGAGRVMVGFNASNALFDTAEETGGSADAIVVSHTHTFSTTTNTAGSHRHVLQFRDSGVGGNNDAVPGSGGNLGATNSAAIAPNGDHSHTVSGTTDSTGSSGTNANYQPYITVYMWKRVS